MRVSILFLLLIPFLTFALPCPNGTGGILYKGDTVADVIQQCGEPQSKQTFTQVVSSSYEWVYYKAHNFDRGSSQMVVLFNNDRVSNIRLTERYPYFVCQQAAVQVTTAFITTQTSCGDWTTYVTYTNFCGWSFGVGDAATYVQSICGTPATQANLQSQTLEQTKFFYGGDSPQTIIFQNGRLTEFQ